MDARISQNLFKSFTKYNRKSNNFLIYDITLEFVEFYVILQLSWKNRADKEFNKIFAQYTISITPKNIRKPKVFWRFQGV